MMNEILAQEYYKALMGGAPGKLDQGRNILKAALLDTPLGPMIAVASEEELYLLEFVDGRGLEREVERLKATTKSAIIPGTSTAIQSIEKELSAYFQGELRDFKTPMHLSGSPFQKMVWDALCSIPYGETRSYLEQARLIGKSTACRAVANANGANQLAIIIPCHRIITSSGELGGYGGGVGRKKWLIEHENRLAQKKGDC